MKVPKWVLALLVWMVLGLPGAGMQLAYFQYKYRMVGNCRENQAFAIGWGLMTGPIGTVEAFFLTGFAEHGLQYRCQ